MAEAERVNQVEVQQVKERNGSNGKTASVGKVGLIRTPSDWQVQRPGPFLLHVDGTREAPVAFALSVAAGLDDEARWLDSRYLYDAAGSELFERITAQPEYYQTRTEERLLAEHARQIRALVGDVSLVELGSGSSSKTRHLLDAWVVAGKSRYIPIDVSAAALEQACCALASRYPCLSLEGIAASYERALPVLAGAAPMMLAFLGSSLGNLGKHQQGEFLDFIASHLAPGDFFLVGLDHVKDPAVLEASYNDAAGVTADFTRNLFARMNRELGTEIPLDAVEHVAYYNGDRERIEIFAEFKRELTLRIAAIDRDFRVARGERIRTELSHKYRPDAVAATVGRHGFDLVQEFHAPNAQHGFGLYLFRRQPRQPRTVDHGPAAHWRAGLAVLDRIRARTLDLVAPLGLPDLTVQHSRLMSPIVWDMGHIAHFESLWLLRKLEGRGTDGDDVASTSSSPTPLDALYDPQSTPRRDRDRLPLPTPAEARDFLADVRQRVRARFEELDPAGAQAEGPLLAHAQVLHLVAQHEAQHQETMFQAIALRDDLPYRPSFIVPAPRPVMASPAAASVLIPAGPFIMGTNDQVWAYDNERPAHRVELAAFRLATTPVSNREYLAFMNDGGYERRELWTPQGWAWRQETNASAPGHWRRDSGGAAMWHAMVFGQRQAIDLDCPVVHVSWYEADAHARWAGKRLPSEAEWEKAAAWDESRQASRRWPWGDSPGDAGAAGEAAVLANANLGQRRQAPAPAGAYPGGRSPYGCLQMIGDVWEWTATWFDGYPGFRSFPYKEYSEIFFGTSYRVLRGGSFVTDVTVARNSFRNWDYPERRQIFAGFRLAEDA
jgi:iron(II)-dependent oxidoreductase